MITANGFPSEKIQSLIDAAKPYADSTTMMVTPELAQCWLAYNDYKDQRKLSKKAVFYLADVMRDGEWNAGRQINFARPKWQPERPVLIDGQHRLHAIVRSNTDQVFSVCYVNVATEDELAEQYYTIDRGHVRTTDDALRVKHLDDEFGISQKKIGRTGSAMRFLARGFKRFPEEILPPKDDNALIAYMRQHRDAIEKYWDAASNVPSAIDIAIRMPVIAVGVAMFHEAEEVYGYEMLKDFWVKSLSGEMLEQGDPRFFVFKHLTTTHLNHSNTVGYVTSEQQSRVIIHCWNYWVRGKKVNSMQIKNLNGLTPIHIRGTHTWK